MTAGYRSHAASSSTAPGGNPQATFPSDVYETAQAACKAFNGGVRHGGGIPLVAQRMGIPEGTLYNKLTPHETSPHKLSVQDLIQVWLVTGNLQPLQALCRTHNCVCFPVPDYSGLSDSALLDLITRIHDEGGQFHGVLHGALQDGRIDARELAQLTKEAYEWIGAIAEAHSRLEGLARA